MKCRCCRWTPPAQPRVSLYSSITCEVSLLQANSSSSTQSFSIQFNNLWSVAVAGEPRGRDVFQGRRRWRRSWASARSWSHRRRVSPGFARWIAAGRLAHHAAVNGVWTWRVRYPLRQEFYSFYSRGAAPSWQLPEHLVRPGRLPSDTRGTAQRHPPRQGRCLLHSPDLLGFCPNKSFDVYNGFVGVKYISLSCTTFRSCLHNGVFCSFELTLFRQGHFLPPFPIKLYLCSFILWYTLKCYMFRQLLPYSSAAYRT